MKTWFRALILASIALVLAAGTAWAGEPADALCVTCHEDLVKQFNANPHARKGIMESDVAACSSCHGNGAKHAEEGDKSLISVPRGGAGAKACLSCHEGATDKAFTRFGGHESADVFCGDCHVVHGGAVPARALLKTAGSDLCFSCHAGQKHEFKKLFAHKVDGNGPGCVSCHNPHGGVDAKSLKVTRAGEPPCMACHQEKAGPFVFSHVTGIAGTCQSCHQPHGSNNPKMLTRARVDKVCFECHSTLTASTLGAQPPSFHDSKNPRYQNCTVCHVAIHGSNSSPMLLK